MKSVILVCGLRDMTVERFGASTWETILTKSGLPKDTVFSPTEDAPAELVLKVAENLCSVLKITIGQAIDAFGEYWMDRYAPRVCSTLHVIAPSSRDFLLELNDIHGKACKAMKAADVPFFEYYWKDENTLMITCGPMQGQMPLFAGLVEGVGRYFDEKLAVGITSSDRIEVKFPESGIWRR
jgi:hypothetical protein